MQAQEPFDVKVTNASGNVAQLDNVLVISTSPVWNTATGTLATINDTATGTHATVNATDADGQTITDTNYICFIWIWFILKYLQWSNFWRSNKCKCKHNIQLYFRASEIRANSN